MENPSVQHEAGIVRWAFNFGAWKPTEEEWNNLLSFIEQEDREKIGKFFRPTKEGSIVGRFNPDAKSALIARLMSKMLVHKEIGIPWKEIVIGRTPEKKPYLVKFRNIFDSHFEGKYVVLGSETIDLIGVDVMELTIDNAKTEPAILEFFHLMDRCFTPFEWKNIRKDSVIQNQVKQFFRHWTLKEAYIKAVGIGLGFELQRAQFSMDSEFRRATILIDGKSQTEWKFGLDYIGDETHSVAVAIGPPNEAIPSFRNFLPNGKKNKIEQETAEKRVSIPFKEVSIEELIPK